MDAQSTSRKACYNNAYILMITAACIWGLALIPLAWLVPMILMTKKARDQVSASTETSHYKLALCTIFFVNGPFGIAAGVCDVVANWNFHNNIDNMKRKKLVLSFDTVSLALTISGVILYILSILALQDWWSSSQNSREIWSIVFTAIGVAFDLSSVLMDIASYFSGKSIYKSITNNTSDAVEQKLSHHEKLSYKLDSYSMFASTVGLSFGIASLILVAVGFAGHSNLDKISWIINIPAIVFDSCSAFLLCLGINQHLKYWHTKNIVKLARESINMSNVRK